MNRAAKQCKFEVGDLVRVETFPKRKIGEVVDIVEAKDYNEVYVKVDDNIICLFSDDDVRLELVYG